MSLESRNPQFEKPFSKEVEDLLPRIVSEIRSATEENNFLSEQAKDLIMMALSQDAHTVASEILDHSKMYADLDSTEKKIRHLLNDKIIREVGPIIDGTNTKENEAFSLLLRYNVLHLRPQN